MNMAMITGVVMGVGGIYFNKKEIAFIGVGMVILSMLYDSYRR